MVENMLFKKANNAINVAHVCIEYYFPFKFILHLLASRLFLLYFHEDFIYIQKMLKVHFSKHTKGISKIEVNYYYLLTMKSKA
jgi:hypothetical protein